MVYNKLFGNRLHIKKPAISKAIPVNPKINIHLNLYRLNPKLQKHKFGLSKTQLFVI